MANNSILPFANIDTGTNLLSDAAYAALSDRTNGVQPGVASSRLQNKTLRQVATMAAGLAQFAADRQNTDVTDGLTPAQVASILSAAFTGRLLRQRLFGSSQTPTYLAATRMIRVRLMGGGCAGGGAPATPAGQISGGTGGGAGCYVEALISSGFINQPLIIGSGGAGQAGANGSQGGTSTFMGLVAGGGSGGVSYGPTGAPFTAGGSNVTTVSGGDLNVQGQAGGVLFLITGTQGLSGEGGHCLWGTGGGSVNASVNGTSGSGFGAGGGGALNYGSEAAKSGGPGRQGACIIEEFE